MAYEVPHDTDSGAPDAEVIPLRPGDGPEQEETPPAPSGVEGERRPILPVSLRGENLKATAERWAAVQAHRTAYHGLRLHWYAIKTLWFAGLGGLGLTARLLAWAGWTDGWLLESAAVARGGRDGHADAMKAHTQGLKTRSKRWQIVAVFAALTGVAVLALAVFAPWWAWLTLSAAAVLVLAQVGKPADAPIVRAAIIPPQYEAPTPEIITRALDSLRIPQISDIAKAGQRLAFVSDVAESGPGWGVQLDLPYGVTPTMILQRREQLASGLRRPLSATWPAAVPHEHAGRLELWIGFHDMSKMKQPAWPLLKAGEADIFAGVPFGTDPRGRTVTAPLFEVNWLIGAAPGQGKTAAVRVLACAAALDVTCDLWIHELAGKGDLEPLAQVCHRYTSGLDEESISYTAASVAMLRGELERRSQAFKKLPKADRPDGKLTRELAERRALKLRPLVCVIDECQNLFIDPAHGKQAAEDVAYVMRLGRAYGIILVLATQRPDSEMLPTAISGITTARFCLKVPDQPANDMILGTGSYKAGYNAAIFRAKTDAGLGWLKGDGDPAVVKSFYLDEAAGRKIAARARATREKAGVLSGYALGEDDTTEIRSFAADVQAVFGADPRLWCETIADRLAERFPGIYADITPAAVGSQLRGIGVTVKNVREPGRNPNSGCERAAVEAAAGVVMAGA